MEKEKIEIEVHVCTKKAECQSKELVRLLKSANSLAYELADTLNNLEVDIKV